MAAKSTTSVEPVISTDQNCISIGEARNRIKAKFTCYRQLLDEKESELLSELDQLEESNKPELTQVRQDLNQLEGVLKGLDESLGASTLKLFVEEQKILLRKQIQHFQGSEKKLSRVSLKFPEFEYFIRNEIQIVPFWSKAKFRAKLEPVLRIEPMQKEDWYIVSYVWLSDFVNSINLTDPKPNDSWEFPVEMPIRTADDNELYNVDSNVKLLHSKAWDVLLAFNGLSPGSIPIMRQPFHNVNTNSIEIPLQAMKHKCTIGHNDGDCKFSFECEIGIFPYETYKDVIRRISGFSSLFTKHSPILYAFDSTSTISCNSPRYTQYTVSMSQPNTQSQPTNLGHGTGLFSAPTIRPLGAPTSSLFGTLNQSCQSQPSIIQQPVHETDSLVRITDQVFLLIIPDSMGCNTFQVI